MNPKYFSRKFILSLLVIFGAAALPVWFKNNGVDDTVTMLVIALFTGVGVAYGFVNIKDASIEKKRQE